MVRTAKMLNAIGDRMLAKLLPSTSAAAALCAGRYIKQSGNCHYYCVQNSGDHTTRWVWCSSTRKCRIDCYDCC